MRKINYFILLKVYPSSYFLTNAAWHRKRKARRKYRRSAYAYVRKYRFLRFKRNWDFDRSFYGKKFRYLNTGKRYFELIKPLREFTN